MENLPKAKKCIEQYISKASTQETTARSRNMEYDFTGIFYDLLRWVSVTLMPLSTSVSQSPHALGVWALAGGGGRMTDGSFLESWCLNWALSQV